MKGVGNVTFTGDVTYAGYFWPLFLGTKELFSSVY